MHPTIEERLVSGDKIARRISETVDSVVVKSAEDIAPSTAASIRDIVSRYSEPCSVGALMEWRLNP